MLGVAPAGGMGVDMASGSRAKGDPLDRRILLGGRARGQNGVSCGQGAIPGFTCQKSSAAFSRASARRTQFLPSPARPSPDSRSLSRLTSYRKTQNRLPVFLALPRWASFRLGYR